MPAPEHDRGPGFPALETARMLAVLVKRQRRIRGPANLRQGPPTVKRGMRLAQGYRCMEQLLRWFRQIGLQDVPLVGGKNASP